MELCWFLFWDLFPWPCLLRGRSSCAVPVPAQVTVHVYNKVYTVKCENVAAVYWGDWKYKYCLATLIISGTTWSQLFLSSCHWSSRKNEWIAVFIKIGTHMYLLSIPTKHQVLYKKCQSGTPPPTLISHK